MSMHRLQRQRAEFEARARATAQFRDRFEAHGFDVARYSDDELSHAILDAASFRLQSMKELFARAFALLHVTLH